MSAPTSAEKVAQAKEDVERIARAFARVDNELLREQGAPPSVIGALEWDELEEGVRDHYRGIVTRLLHADVVRVGRRPQKGEPPMEGQTEIEGGG